MNTTELTGKLAELGFALESTEATGIVKEDWPCLAYTVTLSYQGRGILTTAYHLGTGHVSREDIARVSDNYSTPARYAAYYVTVLRKPYAKFVDQNGWVAAVAYAANRRNVKPHLADVLHSLCVDSTPYFAHSTFEDWAGEYGYDTDSRKALATYEQCIDTGRKLARALPADVLEQVQALTADY
jgi:hypothetical protein